MEIIFIRGIMMWTEKVVLDSIYDFDYTLSRLAFDPLISVDKEARWVDIPVVLQQKKHVVRVQAIGSTEKPIFKVSSSSNEDREELLTYVKDLFLWNVNLVNVESHFRGTNLGELFHRYPGTPIVRDFDLYYSLIKTIIHQQLNMKFAYVLSTRFVEQFGEQYNGIWFYPEAKTIANLTVEDLRDLQFSGRKAEYIIDVSKKITEGELDLVKLSKKSDQVIFSELIKIRGVGPWTVENWLLFGLGRNDLFPKADIGIQRALQAYMGMNSKPTADEMIDFSKDWSPYRSYASLTLWRSIE